MGVKLPFLNLTCQSAEHTVESIAGSSLIQQTTELCGPDVAIARLATSNQHASDQSWAGLNNLSELGDDVVKASLFQRPEGLPVNDLSR